METITVPIKPTKRRARTKIPETPNKLRELRALRGVTLAQCGKVAGVTPQAIYKAQKRTDALAISRWKLLAKLLDTPLHEIV